MLAFTHNLWTGAELLNQREEEGMMYVQIRLLGKATINDVLSSVLPHISLHGLKELVPSMNDIFIACVNAENISVSNHLTE
jgi:hypothetical protein